MALPVVAIVGRPNVGKSSLFNALTGRRISIVEPTPGVTRDRVRSPVELSENCWVELMDTGGIGIVDRDDLTEDVERQIQKGIDDAAMILFVVDARDGIMPLDQLVADRLREVKKPVLLLANKCDTPELEHQAQEFRKFGYEPFLCVSAHQGRGRAELKEAIQDALPRNWDDLAAPAEAEMKIAIVGRRNVGKSTFINALAQEERVIVSEVAGTTRDSIDVKFERDGHTFLAIDTAGVRKKSSVADSIEFYSLARAERSIRRADVVLHFFDAAETVGMVDKQLAAYVVENNKPTIFVINKWDLLREQGKKTGEWADYLHDTFPVLDFVPLAFTTATKQKNVQSVLNLAQQLHKQAQARVGTGKLNQVIRDAVERRPPPLRYKKPARIYYATQIGVCPPSVVIFTNGHDMIADPYQRYLLKCMRDNLPFSEIPIKLGFRARIGEEKKSHSTEPENSRPKRIHSKPEKKLKPIIPTKPPVTKRKTKKQKESDVWRNV